MATNHPCDHIDHAQAMLGFLNLLIGDGRGQMALEERDRAGLCYILSHIEDELKQAQSLLN